MAPHIPDFSLYLVTGRDFLPSGVDYYDSLERTLKTGKVTVVQVREKDADNGEFLDIAQRTLDICDKYGVSMLVNDNLSVALCLPERVGLHIGQDDIPVAAARQLLGPNRLLGLSTHSVEDARRAAQEGVADYVGVGPVHGTQSKAGVTEDKVLGPRGAARVVAALYDEKRKGLLPSVLIGGINANTCARSLVGATSEAGAPSGVAVISAIVARRDPDAAAIELSDQIGAFFTRLPSARAYAKNSGVKAGSGDLISAAASLLSRHRSPVAGPPLIQTITSHVSSTMSANIALAFSSSPIMSHEAIEAADLAKVVGGVVLNIGTISSDSREGMRAVGREANKTGKPVVLDPVGVGASAFRRSCVERIMSETQVTLVKGNAAEISSIAGLTEVASRGVDSGAGQLKDPVALVQTLARREKCLVLLTGKTDYLSDGSVTVGVDNGHPLLGSITGSGCALGVMLSAGMATACRVTEADATVEASLPTLLVNANASNLFLGALMALLSMTVASELAAARADVKGPGTFISALIDEIANLGPQALQEHAKVRVLEAGSR